MNWWSETIRPAVQHEEFEPNRRDRVVGEIHHLPLDLRGVVVLDRRAAWAEAVLPGADVAVVGGRDTGVERVVADRLHRRRVVGALGMPELPDRLASDRRIGLVPHLDVALDQVREILVHYSSRIDRPVVLR
jgi:hypothetical protein